MLSEAESKRICTPIGFLSSRQWSRSRKTSAVAAGVRLGFPVVLKLHSQTITHKTDVGGVVLNISSEAAVRDAFRSIRQSVEEKAGPGHFQGVAVQRMLPRGYELILGSS